MGNPFAAGVYSGSSIAAQNQRAYPQTLSFGQPFSGTATVSRTSAIGGTGTGNLTQGVNFPGASSIGVRRAPNYVVEPVFDVPERVLSGEPREDLQAVISRSSRLPSRDSIRVTTEGGRVVLRGQVRDEREKRLAESIVRLTPGVREVRNELQPRQ
jgi:hypothetical protein